MKVIKNQKGYFVTGKGFVATTAADASKFPENEVESVIACLNNAGLGEGIGLEDFVDKANGSGIIQNTDGSSFGVRFVRAKDIRSDGSITARKKKYSGRTFRAEAEAKQHGARFARLEGHVGFVLVPLARTPVNAWVNEFTGKTNPEIGKRRTDRQ